MRKRQLIFITVFIIGVSLLIAAAITNQPPFVRPLGLSTHRLQFGSSGIGSVGWLMPANTTVSTSHTANQTLTGFLEATLNVFPYKIWPGTVLYLSLYTNNQLVANARYSLSGIYQTPATVVGAMGADVANFSNSMLGFTVSELPLSNTLPTGTVVTLVAWADHPIWVQIDSASTTRSYVTQGATLYSPAQAIVQNSGTMAPHTLSVGVESNA